MTELPKTHTNVVLRGSSPNTTASAIGMPPFKPLLTIKAELMFICLLLRQSKTRIFF